MLWIIFRSQKGVSCKNLGLDHGKYWLYYHRLSCRLNAEHCTCLHCCVKEAEEMEDIEEALTSEEVSQKGGYSLRWTAIIMQILRQIVILETDGLHSRHTPFSPSKLIC